MATTGGLTRPADGRTGSVAARAAELENCAEAAATCTRCDLYRRATQTVFGEGRAGARVMLVGEQPGDREDIEGEPFVGPAGGLLDSAITAAGLARGDVYLTNAVKHFKFEERGKRRIHKRPSAGEVQACHTWLEQEVRLVVPRVVVCLGATAARAVLGRPVTIHSVRGQVLDGPDDMPVVVTIHPSAVLRARDSEERSQLRRGLVRDLVLAAQVASPDGEAAMGDLP
jgi:uracil-DNA glycosylase family protein